MHAIRHLVSHWLASGKLLVSHCKRAWEGSVRKFELPHEPRRKVQGSLSQELPRDGGWKTYCQCSHNSRRANQGPRILPAGPPTPKFNVGSLMLGPLLRVEEILPVNIEIGGAGGHHVSVSDSLSYSCFPVNLCKRLAIVLPPTVLKLLCCITCI
jgi:hypothetical protein